MSDAVRRDQPLASYVLRVRGRPATLRYELCDLRSGNRRVFVKVDRLAAFLREQGLALADLESDLELPAQGGGTGPA